MRVEKYLGLSLEKSNKGYRFSTSTGYATQKQIDLPQRPGLLTEFGYGGHHHLGSRPV